MATYTQQLEAQGYKKINGKWSRGPNLSNPAPAPAIDPRKQQALLNFQANHGIVTNSAVQNKSTANATPPNSAIPTTPGLKGVKLVTGSNGQKSFGINFSDGSTGSSAAKADTFTDGAGNTHYVMSFADGSSAKNISKEQFDAFWQTGKLPVGNTAQNITSVAKVAGSVPTSTNKESSGVITPDTTATDTSTPPPTEIPVPTDEELTKQFFASSYNKTLQEKSDLQAKRDALEAEMLQFQQDQQLQQDREAASRNAQTAQALTGGVGNFGGGNIGLAAGIEQNGIEHLDNEIRANRLELRQLIQNQDEIGFNLSAEKQNALQTYIDTKKKEVLDANIAEKEDYYKQRDYDFKVQTQQNDNLKWMLDFGIKQSAEKRAEEEAKSTKGQNQIKTIQAIYGFGKDFYGKNPSTDAFLMNLAAENGVTLTPDFFDIKTQEDLKNKLETINLFTGIADKNPGLIPMMNGWKLSEMGFSDNATLESIAEAVFTDRGARLLQEAQAKAIAEGNLSIFGGGAGGLPGVSSGGASGGVPLGGGFTVSKGTTQNIPDAANNPGNIKAGGVADQYAAKNSDGSPRLLQRGQGNFLVFDSPEAGFQALVSDISAKQQGRTRTGLGPNSTIAQFVQKYANTQNPNYINSIVQATGASGPNASIGNFDPIKMAQGIARGEGFTGQVNISPQAQAQAFGTDAVTLWAQQYLNGTLDPFKLPSEANQSLIAQRATELLQSGYKPSLPPKEKITIELQLQDNFRQNAGDAQKVLTNLSIIQSALQRAEGQYKKDGSINAASQAIITTFNKILDPSSVVREAEYARTQDGQSLVNTFQGQFEKLKQGGAGVTIEGLRDFAETAQRFSESYKDYIKNQAQVIRNNAQSYGLEEGNILPPNVIDILGPAQGKTSGAKVLTPIQVSGYQKLIDSGKIDKNALGAYLQNSGYSSDNLSQFTFR